MTEKTEVEAGAILVQQPYHGGRFIIAYKGASLDGMSYPTAEAAQAELDAIRAALNPPPPAGDTGEAVACDFPMGAIENGRAFADRLEQTGLECPAGDLRMCSDWTEFRRCFEWLANWALARPSDAALRGRVAELERLDREAATYVESVICMRTRFTGEPPYVGWKGLGLALTEELDELDRLRARAHTGGTDV